MQRANVYLAITAYYFVLRRFIYKTLRSFLYRVKRFLNCCFSPHAFFKFHSTILPDLFFTLNSSLNIGLSNGYLKEFLRN